MSQNDIDDVLDYLTRIKNGDSESSSVNIDRIEELQMQIRLFRTFSKYNHLFLPDFLDIIRKMAKLILKKLHSVFDKCKTNLNLERLESQLLEFIEGDTILRYDYELKDSYLSEYMDCVGKNLYDIRIWLEKNISDRDLANEEILEINPFIKQLKMVQKKMGFLRYLYVSEVNGHVDHEKLEGLETRIQFMAGNVGQFFVYFTAVSCDIKTDEGGDYTNIYDILSKPPYLLCLIVLVDLEMKKIFLGELKASKFSQSRTFKDQKLPKGFSHSLHSLLMYLRNKKLENFPNNNSAQIMNVVIEFLLVFLNADVSYHVSNGKKLNEVMVQVGAIAGDVLYVVQKLLPSSIKKDDTSKVSLCSIQIFEKTKDLKEQMETYYKSLKFRSLSQFPTVGELSFLDSLLRKLKEMLKSESLDFMMKSNIGFSEKEFSSLTTIFEKDFSSLTSILEKELSSLTFVFRDVVIWPSSLA